MSFRRFYYTRPFHLKKLELLTQPDAILDFGQLERKSDYYRKQAGLNRYAVSVMFIVFFLSLFGAYGFYSLIPGSTLPEVQLTTEENLALAQPTATTKKVVESVSLEKTEKTYSYTVMNGDSYTRLVKRAVKDYSTDHDITLSTRELNRTVYLIISGLERLPLHPGETFTLPSQTINDALLVIKP